MRCPCRQHLPANERGAFLKAFGMLRVAVQHLQITHAQIALTKNERRRRNILRWRHGRTLSAFRMRFSVHLIQNGCEIADLYGSRMAENEPFLGVDEAYVSLLSPPARNQLQQGGKCSVHDSRRELNHGSEFSAADELLFQLKNSGTVAVEERPCGENDGPR